MDFTQKHCVPCEGGEDPLSRSVAKGYLKATAGWEILDEEPMKLRRKFVFGSFKQAMEFVSKVADLAEKEGHHPDINLHSFRKVDITSYTHAISGLSENDYILAAKINQLL